MKHLTTAILLLLLAGGHAMGQVPGKAMGTLNGNKVKATLSNGSDHFWDFTGKPRYEVPAGSGIHSNFAHSLWIGGLDQSNALHVAGQTYRQLGEDFYSGPYRSTHQYDNGLGFAIPTEARHNGLANMDGGKMIVTYLGGFSVYDPATNTTVTANTPTNRQNLQAAPLPTGKTLLFGDDFYPTITNSYILDVGNGYIPQLPITLNYFHQKSLSVTLGNGKVLIAGVVGAEIYDPTFHSSTTTQAMAVPVAAAGAVLLQDGRVFVAGGAPTFNNLNTGRRETQIYDPVTGQWTQGPNMPDPMVYPVLQLLPNGKVIIVPGSSASGDIIEYDPIANSMSVVATLPAPMVSVRGGVLPNGKLIFVGASTYNGMNSSIFTYDRTTGIIDQKEFVLLGNQAFVMANGKVIVEFEHLTFKQYDPATGNFVGMPFQKIWHVTKSQVSQFLTDYNNSTVNFANYPDIRTWPGEGNPALGEDVHLAPYRDLNNDGLYRPLLQGDYPCFPGDEAMWWVFHDDGPHDETGGQKLDVQVEGMAYVYDCSVSPCPDSALDYSTFFHYEITNRSNQTYHDVYVGIFNDVDLGNPFDDFMGSDSTRHLAFMYNGDANDESAAGYGLNPPAYGSVLLGNTHQAAAVKYNNDFTIMGIPQAPQDYYGYLTGYWRDSSHIVNNGLDGYPNTAAGSPTNYMFSGDPGFCGGASTGWSEVSAGNSPFDRMMLQSAGPYTLLPGQSVNIDFALIWARDNSNGNLGSVCRLFAATDTLRAAWGDFDQSCFNLVLNKPTATPTGSLKVYPNPSNGSFTIKASAATGTGNIAVYDITGRVVHTQQVQSAGAELKLNLQHLAKGMYTISMTTEDRKYTEKLVIE